MARILLQCVPNFYKVGCEFNRGDAAVIASTVSALRRVLPDAEFVSPIRLTRSFSARCGIETLAPDVQVRRGFLRPWALFVRCLCWRVLRRSLGSGADCLIKDPVLNQIRESDIIVDISMDLFNCSPTEISLGILCGVALGKPVAVYGQTIRPIEGRVERWLSREALRRASVVTPREENSRRYLEELGVTQTPINVTADPAFLLEVAPEDRVAEILASSKVSSRRPLIGIAVPTTGELWGASMDWRGAKRLVMLGHNALGALLPRRVFDAAKGRVMQMGYFESMRNQRRTTMLTAIAQVADRLVEETGAQVVFIPTIVYPSWYDGAADDDASVVNQAYDLANHKESIARVTGEYSAEETKGVIGRCDLFVSLTKFHPYVFATSQAVPSILVGSDVKLKGIAALLDQEEWRCETLSHRDILAKVTVALTRREQLRRELEERMKDIKRKSSLNAELVRSLLMSQPT